MEDLSIVKPSAISLTKIRGETNQKKKKKKKKKTTKIFSNPHNLASVGAFIFLEETIKKD